MTQTEYREIAKRLTSARGIYYRTQESPTFDQLIDMVEQADNVLSDTFGRYDQYTIQTVVRHMLAKNESASRICANPLNI